MASASTHYCRCLFKTVIGPHMFEGARCSFDEEMSIRREISSLTDSLFFCLNKHNYQTLLVLTLRNNTIYIVLLRAADPATFLASNCVLGTYSIY